MSEVFTNDTGCIVTQSHITGDILCRWPGPNCDCLVRRTCIGYAPEAHRELADELDENAVGDVADHLRTHGVPETRQWIDNRIAEVRAGEDPFDPDGQSLGNLEVARDRLEWANSEADLEQA